MKPDETKPNKNSSKFETFRKSRESFEDDFENVFLFLRTLFYSLGNFLHTPTLENFYSFLTPILPLSNCK